MRLLLIGVLCLSAIVVIAALLDMVPPTAGLLVSLAAIVISATMSYLTSFRGPDIRLILAPEKPFNNSMVSGYSAGMPSTWILKVNLLAINDAPRPGVLTGFEVEMADHLPRGPRAFDVSFSNLEWEKPAHPSAFASSFPVPLPLVLQAQAREKVSFRAMLTFSTADPAVLAEDLREVRGLRVRYHYRAGTEEKQKHRSGKCELIYDELKKGVREYWQGATQFQRFVRQLDGMP